MVLRILEMALDRARAVGASYADARSLQQADERLTVRNGQVEQARSGMSYGLGVRVLVDGQWGFAAGSVVSEAEASRLAGLAVEIAKAGSAARKREVRLACASSGRHLGVALPDRPLVSADSAKGRFAARGMQSRAGRRKRRAGSRGVHVGHP